MVDKDGVYVCKEAQTAFRNGRVGHALKQLSRQIPHIAKEQTRRPDLKEMSFCNREEDSEGG